jgi:protein phosphatase
MKIVIISDIHANYDALSALPESYDELWVLGDLVNYGPQPKEVVEWARKNATVVVRGNHDQAVGYDEDPRCTPRYHDMAEATRKISLAALPEKDKQFLRRLPLQVQREREGVRFFLCHAIPSNPLYGYCPEESDRWIKELEAISADALLVGHTHTPFIKTIGRQVVVNPGSLGQPKTGRSDACYAVWQDGQFALKQFSYPVQQAVVKLRGLGLPQAVEQDLETVLQTGTV